MKKVILIILAVLVVVGLIFGFLIGGEFLNNNLDNTAAVTVEPGNGTIAIASELAEQNVIKYEKVFTAYAMAKGYNDKWVSGDFEIAPGMGYEEICKILTTPVRSDVKVVLIEGKQARQMAQTLEEAGICSADGFMAAVQTNDYDFEFLKDITNENPLEGYLFPDTYYFEKNTEPRVVVETLLKGFEQNMYKQEYIDRAAELGYTFHEMIILASVVQSESSGEDNQKLVAGVFHNRLNNEAFGMLQSCVTVEYALGIKKSILTYEDTQVDSPYNTYKYPGLPIGPISNPGVSALEATLWYTESDYYYFQSDKNGKMYYAATEAEHNAIKSEVQADWSSEVIEVY
ncbi:MAG: endolytic transglycosylase MltG [Firmicutes bacterium]|nr:endolytic transglycosylase MltG [Bacillota bacterium]